MDTTVVLFVLGAVFVALGLFFILKHLLKIALVVVLLAAFLFAGYWFLTTNEKTSSSPAVKEIGNFVDKASDFGSNAIRTGKEIKENVAPVVEIVKGIADAVPARSEKGEPAASSDAGASSGSRSSSSRSAGK